MLNVPLATLNTVDPDHLVGDDGDGVGGGCKARRAVAQVPAVHGADAARRRDFLVVKAIEYSDKFSHDLYPSTNNFLGLYFTLTGLHAIHVIAGWS